MFGVPNVILGVIKLFKRKKEITKMEIKETKTNEELEKDAVMDEPQILPHDAKFMTPEKQLMGTPEVSDPHLFLITLQDWPDFLRFLEPFSRKIFGSDSPTPNLPVFYNIDIRSGDTIVTFAGLSGFRKKSVLLYSYSEKTKKLNIIPESLGLKIEKKSEDTMRKIKALEDKGYIVVQGEIDPYL